MKRQVTPLPRCLNHRLEQLVKFLNDQRLNWFLHTVAILLDVISTNSLNCWKVHDSVVQKFKLKCPEMTGETGMSLAVAGRKRLYLTKIRRQR